MPCNTCSGNAEVFRYEAVRLCAKRKNTKREYFYNTNNMKIEEIFKDPKIGFV